MKQIIILITLLFSLSAVAQDIDEMFDFLEESVANSDATHPELALQLLSMMKTDQIARTRQPINPEETAEIDRTNTQSLKDIIKTHGWPTISMVGTAGSQAAWLIVQHADFDNDFQHEVLNIIKPLVADGEISASNYAYLYDRVNDPQLYGTQGRCVGNQQWAPREIENPEMVDERREEMNIMPNLLSVYISNMNKRC